MSKWRIFIVSLVLLTLLVTLISGCDYIESEPSNSTNNEATKEYTLNIEVDPSDGGNTSPAVGTRDYDDETEVAVTATAADGYVFDSWSGDVADANSASTTVTMDGDKTVTANFTEIVEVTYDLTMAVNGDGTITPAVGVHTYNEGDIVDITATPDSGWLFLNWDGAVGDPNSAGTTVTMDGDKTVSANFTPAMYTLTVEVDYDYGGNEVTISQPGPYETGTEVTLTAIPADGYIFSQWDGDVGDPNSASTTVTMDADETVTAHFTPTVWYDLTIIIVPSYQATVYIDTPLDTHTTKSSVTLTYAPGTEVTLTIKPSAGNSLDGWVVDETFVGEEVSITVIMDSDKEIKALLDCG